MKYEIKSGKSGIHINPANKGKFTATKKKTGKSTEELTHSKNPLTRKRAVFAQNAKKWKHETGGEVQYKNGTDNKRNAPKYANASKKGSKLVAKNQNGGKLPDITNILAQWKN